MPKFLNDIQLVQDPTTGLEAATKQYLDALVAARSKGSLGWAQITSNSSGVSSSTLAAVSGLSVTVTLASGRCYRVLLSGATENSTAGSSNRIVVDNGSGTALWDYNNIETPDANNAFGFEFAFLVNNPSSGSATFRVMLARGSAGTGTAKISAGATYPAYIAVEDIGLAL